MISTPTLSDLDWVAMQPFGAEVHGFDVSRASASGLAQLKLLLARHGVVVLRGANSTGSTGDENCKSDASGHAAADADDRFVEFLKRLGRLTFTAGETPVASQPMLNIVSNMGRTTPPKSVFHTDTSYVSQPPAYTALRPVMLPEAGGETVFSNQFVAYDTLPPHVKQLLAHTHVLHRVSGLPSEAGAEPAECWHPLFKVHPLSGRRALFLSTPQRCQAMSDVATDKAQRVIKILYQHSTRAHRLYHHRWCTKDLLIWDNRCTMHRGDHSGVIGNRVFHRGMVLAEDDTSTDTRTDMPTNTPI